MSRILLVEDDPEQLDVRRLLLEMAGHEVEIAGTRDEALARCPGCQIVVMDLIPGSSEIVEALPADTRLIVLSGREPVESGRHADRVLKKPCPSRELLRAISQLLLFFLVAVVGSAQTFVVPEAGEMVAELDLRAPGTDWGEASHPAALANVILDGQPSQNIMLYAGAERFTYSIFLGRVAAGQHSLKVAGPGIEVLGMRFHQDPSDVLANAPVLYARPNTIGKFTDIPLITYCERLHLDRFPVLQYTVIYSNEDAGTSTRALMARWGRTTDIEWVYKVFLNPDGSAHHATIQVAEHKEVAFRGKRAGKHPLLITWTDNNNVADDATSPVRYQIPPSLIDLSQHSREQLMDQHPFAYLVMAKELKRELKLRPFGTVEGQNVSDPRNYLYFEARLANHDSALDFKVRLKNDPRWFSSNLGLSDYAIGRNGWVRSTVELPPGAKANQIAEIGLECVTPEEKVAGTCEVLAVSKAFLLDDGYQPGPNIWTLDTKQKIPTGLLWTFSLR